MDINANPIQIISTKDETTDSEKGNSDSNCEDFATTVIMNRDLIIEHKYSYFHHDEEDVQQNIKSFIDESSNSSVIYSI